MNPLLIPLLIAIAGFIALCVLSIMDTRTWSNRVKEHRKENKELRAQIGAFTGICKALKDKIRELTKENEALSKENKELRAQIEEFTKERKAELSETDLDRIIREEIERLNLKS